MNASLDDIRDTFRAQLLVALDKAARKTIGAKCYGANDQDLPRLFRALDEQIRVLANRYNVNLAD